MAAATKGQGLAHFQRVLGKRQKIELNARWLCFVHALSYVSTPQAGLPQNCPIPHTEVVCVIVETMQNAEDIEIPLLGRMAMVSVTGKNPKLILH